MNKTVLNILVEHKADGKQLPKTILWPDGRRFDIDKVLDVRQAASLKIGGRGMRYVCRICGRERVIFDVNGLWYVEG